MSQHPFTYADLFPESPTVRLAITPDLFTYSDRLRRLITDHGVLQPLNGGDLLIDDFIRNDRRMDYYDEPAVRAALAFRLPLDVVVRAVKQAWERPLSAERDRRLEVAMGSEQTSSKRTQAMRGHITRVLISELRTVLLGMGVKLKPLEKKGDREKQKKP